MRTSLQASRIASNPPASLSLAKAFVGGKWTGSYGWQMPNGFIRCSPLNREWSSRKQPPFETGKLCFEQKQFRVSLYKHEAASTWNKISVKVLGWRHRRRVLSASLFTSLRKQANWFQSPATHRIFDSGLVSRNNASTKSQAYWMNETWNKYNKYKQKTRHFSPYTSRYASSDARSTSGNSLVFDSPRHRCGSIHSAGAVLPPGNSTCHLWNSWNRRNQTHIDIFPQWT